MCNHRGIALIELWLIVALIALLCVLAWPRLSGVAAHTQLKNTAAAIAETIRYAQDCALNEQRRYQITFNILEKKYAVSVEEDPVNNPGQFTKINDSLSQNRRIPEGIVVRDSARTTLIIEPDGIHENFYITLENTKGQRYSIRCEEGQKELRMTN